MRGGCARRIVPSTCSCHATCPGRSRGNGCRWVTGPTVVSPGCGGSCVGRSQVAVALSAVTDLPKAVGSPAATCQPFRSRVLLAADLWAGGLEAAPRDLRHRGGVAIDRHNDKPKLRSLGDVVKKMR